jgi:short-subunit dehydrogenase
MSSGELSGATVLITGASQGIGRALAGHFGARCRHVVVTARRESDLDHTVARVRQQGGSCDFIAADLSRREDIERLASTLVERGVRVDVLVHNAADVTSKAFAETSLGEIDALVSTNVIGPLQLTRALLGHFRPDGLKTIVWISSLSGYKPNPAQTVYSITKSAVNGAALALRAELGGQGFTLVNAPLSSVDLANLGGEGRVPVHRVCTLIEQAIRHRKHEVFISPTSRMLMRFYGMFPGLMRF